MYAKVIFCERHFLRHSMAQICNFCSPSSTRYFAVVAAAPPLTALAGRALDTRTPSSTPPPYYCTSCRVQYGERTELPLSLFIIPTLIPTLKINTPSQKSRKGQPSNPNPQAKPCASETAETQKNKRLAGLTTGKTERGGSRTHQHATTLYILFLFIHQLNY